MMLQQTEPDDYVIATGIQYSVREFLLNTAGELGIKLKFKGEGLDEVAIVTAIDHDRSPGIKVNDIIMRIDPNYYRPTEVDSLLGDATKAKKLLGWEPEISFNELVKEMVKTDLKFAKQTLLLDQIQ